MPIFILFLLIITNITHAQVSHFGSSVAGITIPNTHMMNNEETTLRGMEPRKKVDELLKQAVTDVLIFKNSTKGEVEKEIEALNNIGINIHHVPFKWKSFASEQQACEEVIEALAIIKKVEAAGGKIFFHCTVGEDRTGLLAGVYRLINQGWTKEQVFKDEMCARGYADGNPKKPKMVVDAIHKELTPLFFALATRIEEGRKVSKAICREIVFDKELRNCK